VVKGMGRRGLKFISVQYLGKLFSFSLVAFSVIKWMKLLSCSLLVLWPFFNVHKDDILCCTL